MYVVIEHCIFSISRIILFLAIIYDKLIYLTYYSASVAIHIITFLFFFIFFLYVLQKGYLILDVEGKSQLPWDDL